MSVILANDSQALVPLKLETWDIQLETGDSPCEEQTTVTLWIYGDRGVERVHLGEENWVAIGGRLFQSHAKDDFQVFYFRYI